MRKESDADHFNCIICKEDRLYYSVGICDHRKVCLYCSLRSRILYKDKKCPICTTKLEHVYIFEIHEKPSILEIESNKDFYYPDDDYEENGIYFAGVSAKEEALKLKSYICPIRHCNDGALDNLQTLCTHLNKVHKRYYCETCLKEGKRFLSEMPIYTYESLNEHIINGEFSDKGTLIVPPHPFCGFCNIKFYNDEHLFKHMNEHHFICQMCKDKKNIVFYKEITQLLDHYKVLHYVCPYQECLEDMFVVFDTEEKLNSHLLTKHKCLDAQHKLTSFHFSDKKKNEYDYPNKYTKTYSNRDEFNFTQYVNELKEKVKECSKRIQENNRFVKEEEFGNYNQDHQEEHHNYNRGGSYHEGSQSYNQNYQNNKYSQNNRNNQYNQNYNQNDQYNNNTKYPSNQHQKGSKKTPTDLFNMALEEDHTYNNTTYADSQYQNQNQDTFYNHNTYYDQSNTRGKGRGNKNMNMRNERTYNNPQSYCQHPEETQSFQPVGRKNRHFKQPLPKQDSFKQPSEPIKSNIKSNIKIDYSFVFNSFNKILKEYIINLIQKDKPREEDFIVPRETIYQLIIIIDKLNSDQLLELTSLANFGIDLDIYRELRQLMSEANFEQRRVNSILSRLEIKKVLIVYKYCSIACKKIDGIFYKLELEQIDQDTYDDFVTRDRKYKKPQVINDGYKQETRKIENKSKPKPIDFDPRGKKWKMNEEIFPSLIGMSNAKTDNNNNKGESKLKNLFNLPKKEEPANTTIKPSEDNKIKVDVPRAYTPNENKLTLLFDNKLSLVKKETPKPKQAGKGILKNYEEDFPEL